ncbi:MAG: twin-arginine translocase subunit TatC [Chlamydiia bacterium]|nr:twin-arginine translocase subunit TatC [Chlamydiia bacterium]
MTITDPPTALWIHLEALRTLLIRSLIGVGIAALFAWLTIAFWMHLLIWTLETSSPHPPTLALLSPLEGFFISLKVALSVGFMLSTPYWGWHLFQFIAPALHATERRKVIPFLLSTSLTTLLSLYLCYYYSIRYANRYFSQFNDPLGVNFWSLSAYFDWALSLGIAHVLFALLATLLFFSIHWGIFSYTTLKEYRRHAIVASFLLGALFTPPDILSQIFFAIPLILLYELSLIWSRCKIHTKR